MGPITACAATVLPVSCMFRIDGPRALRDFDASEEDLQSHFRAPEHGRRPFADVFTTGPPPCCIDDLRGSLILQLTLVSSADEEAWWLLGMMPTAQVASLVAWFATGHVAVPRTGVPDIYAQFVARSYHQAAATPVRLLQMVAQHVGPLAVQASIRAAVGHLAPRVTLPSGECAGLAWDDRVLVLADASSGWRVERIYARATASPGQPSGAATPHGMHIDAHDLHCALCKLDAR